MDVILTIELTDNARDIVVVVIQTGDLEVLVVVRRIQQVRGACVVTREA